MRARKTRRRTPIQRGAREYYHQRFFGFAKEMEERQRIVDYFVQNHVPVLQHRTMAGLIRLEVDPKQAYRAKEICKKLVRMGFEGVRAYIKVGKNRVEIVGDKHQKHGNQLRAGVSRGELDFSPKAVKKKQGRVKSVSFLDASGQWVGSFHVGML